MDMITLQQGEATQIQYVFCFIVVNMIFLICFLKENSKRSAALSWILMLFFCVYAYWDTDYFTLRQGFYGSLEDFRDPFYYYISLISFNSYSIFRLYIWGVALYLFVKTIKRLSLPQNLSALIFSVFFLLTFSYARVSLGMAMYFYGASLLFKPAIKGKKDDILIGTLFVLGSILGHRSLILLILMTPFCFVKMTKFRISIIFIATIIIGISFKLILSSILVNGFGRGAIGDAALHYANMEAELTYNWKFTLIRNLRFYSIYVLSIYVIWKTYFSKYRTCIDEYVRKMVKLSIYLLAVAYCFMSTGMLGAEIIGYRYLYMQGIPLCIILTYLVKNKMCGKLTMYLLLFAALIYAEGFIFGKILSF